MRRKDVHAMTLGSLRFDDVPVYDDAARNDAVAKYTCAGVDEQRCDSTTMPNHDTTPHRRVTAVLVDPRACVFCNLISTGRVVDGRVVKS